MRTTVTLESDVFTLLQKTMAEKGLTFKQAINDAIRAGFTKKRAQRFATPVFDMGDSKVPLDKALHLAAELEDAEILRKFAEGK